MYYGFGDYVYLIASAFIGTFLSGLLSNYVNFKSIIMNRIGEIKAQSYQRKANEELIKDVLDMGIDYVDQEVKAGRIEKDNDTRRQTAVDTCLLLFTEQQKSELNLTDKMIEIRLEARLNQRKAVKK